MAEVMMALPSEPHAAAGVAIQADDDAGLTTHVRNIPDTSHYPAIENERWTLTPISLRIAHEYVVGLSRDATTSALVTVGA
jgi:hypothetical protein